MTLSKKVEKHCFSVGDWNLVIRLLALISWNVHGEIPVPVLPPCLNTHVCTETFHTCSTFAHLSLGHQRPAGGACVCTQSSLLVVWVCRLEKKKTPNSHTVLWWQIHCFCIFQRWLLMQPFWWMVVGGGRGLAAQRALAGLLLGEPV